MAAWAAAPERGGPLVLALESSCDETAAAVLDGRRSCLSSVVASQVDIHARYGGVVPELASRAHILAVEPVTREALEQAGVTGDQLAAVVVTRGPGLTGSLLVALEFAKGIGLAQDIPVLGVHHLEGHLMAPWLEVAPGFDANAFPQVALLVSGGHTAMYEARAPGVYRELGRTLDDAAGEAYDKLSKMLGLGYPGGAVIDRLAAEGDPERYALPRPMLRGTDLRFSFSGLKTAVATLLGRVDAQDPQVVRDVSASFQAAVVEILTEKLFRAADRAGVDHVVVSGGVACNSRLRASVRARATATGRGASIPPPALCTDNAAMIGAAGYARAASRAGTGFASAALDATSSWGLADVVP
jgi:N6-L-threonylcarbamoyladenine synthase